MPGLLRSLWLYQVTGEDMKNRTHRQFPKRSKDEIRLWLQTPEGKAWLERKIHKKDEGKAARRMRETIDRMKRLGLHHDCAKCLHGIGGHCPWALPDGCLDYWEVGKEVASHLPHRGAYAGDRHG